MCIEPGHLHVESKGANEDRKKCAARGFLSIVTEISGSKYSLDPKLCRCTPLCIPMVQRRAATLITPAGEV